MPLRNALQILSGENTRSFLLTIQCNTEAIYCYGVGRLRIFDSRARNLSGLPHPQGTCVLLDVDGFSALINYFQTLYELRGVHVIAEISIQSNATESPFSRQTDTKHSEVIGCS